MDPGDVRFRPCIVESVDLWKDVWSGDGSFSSRGGMWHWLYIFKPLSTDSWIGRHTKRLPNRGWGPIVPGFGATRGLPKVETLVALAVAPQWRGPGEGRGPCQWDWGSKNNWMKV